MHMVVTLGLAYPDSLQPAMMHEQTASAKCPSENPPIGVLYNHISKTGGTSFKELLRDILSPDRGQLYNMKKDHKDPSPDMLKLMVPHGALVVQSDLSVGLQLEASDAQRYFTMGLVRRPCDFAVSSWAYDSAKSSHLGTAPDDIYGTTANLDTDEDIASFWRYYQYHAKLCEGNCGLAYHSMSRSLDIRMPDQNLVHCWVRTHEMVGDTKKCISQFQSCGGNVTIPSSAWSELERKYAPMMESDHATCSSYFNSTQMDEVLKAEQGVIDKYSLGSCCS